MPLGAKLLSDKSACAEWKFGGAAGLGWCWTLDKAFERQSGPRSGPPGGDLSPDLPTLVAGSGVAGGNQEWVECKKEGERVGDSHRPEQSLCSLCS